MVTVVVGGNDVRYDSDHIFDDEQRQRGSDSGKNCSAFKKCIFATELIEDSGTNKQVNFSLLKRGADVMERRLLKNKTGNSTNKLNFKAKTLIYIKLCQDTSFLRF